jgi:hypothetical protein
MCLLEVVRGIGEVEHYDCSVWPCRQDKPFRFFHGGIQRCDGFLKYSIEIFVLKEWTMWMDDDKDA